MAWLLPPGSVPVAASWAGSGQLCHGAPCHRPYCRPGTGPSGRLWPRSGQARSRATGSAACGAASAPGQGATRQNGVFSAVTHPVWGGCHLDRVQSGHSRPVPVRAVRSSRSSGKWTVRAHRVRRTGPSCPPPHRSSRRNGSDRGFRTSFDMNSCLGCPTRSHFAGPSRQRSLQKKRPAQGRPFPVRNWRRDQASERSISSRSKISMTSPGRMSS